jgi:uncharacterized OB-fold protein
MNMLTDPIIKKQAELARAMFAETVARARAIDDLRAKNERLRDELESLRAQLYGTQCEDCAGQGMPQKAVLYCCHCGQPFTRVVEGKG